MFPAVWNSRMQQNCPRPSRPVANRRLQCIHKSAHAASAHRLFRFHSRWSSRIHKQLVSILDLRRLHWTIRHVSARPKQRQNRHRVHHQRTSLPLPRPRRRPLLQQIKRARASMRKRPRPSQRKKRSRIFRHSFPPTLFFFILENPAEAHRKGIAHGWPPLSDSNSTRPACPPPQKQKRLTLSSVSRSVQFWLLAISCRAAACAAN